jgi:hypothetical protein
MATTISQLGVLSTETGAPAQGVQGNLRSLGIRLQIGSPQARIDLDWLVRQRELLGSQSFQRLVGSSSIRDQRRRCWTCWTAGQPEVVLRDRRDPILRQNDPVEDGGVFAGLWQAESTPLRCGIAATGAARV